MTTNIQSQNGNGCNALDTKIHLNDVLWSSGNNAVEHDEAEEVVWANKHEESISPKLEVQSQENGAESHSTEQGEILLENEGDCEVVTIVSADDLEKHVPEDSPLLEEVVVDSAEANDNEILETASNQEETSNENGEIVNDEPNENAATDSTEPLSDEPAIIPIPYISGRPALRGGSPFNSSFTVRSEPCSPNPAQFPRLRKADAMASLTSPGKRSHDESSSSSGDASESSAKRLCRNLLPAGLTRWWKGEENQAEENKASCSLM